MKNCPWCGKTLEVKGTDTGKHYRYTCASCGYKLKEVEKPVQPVKEEQPRVVEIADNEKPVVIQSPRWPLITGAIALIALAIILVKVFLV